ncbi:MAG TPA: hypothetical protein ENF26_06850 [Methanomicrobia archaeon]|nr:hypothetical protein [Methanomicrobia archaeon]HEX59845.1 hypothetical protein [Methanomicrobia archaeon]
MRTTEYCGYCPLIGKCVPFLVTSDYAVVCLLGGEPGQTCEHLIVVPKRRLREFMNMPEEEIAEYYGSVVLER